MPNHLFRIKHDLFVKVFMTLLGLSLILFPMQASAQDYYQNNSINAGVFLHIPFGPTKKNEDRMKYGLRLNMSQEINYRSQWNSRFQLNNRKILNADILSLNFSEGGFRSISFAGRQAFVYQNGMLRAASNGGEGGRSIGNWIFIGGAALGLGFIVAATAE
ncbi:hypothetical protein MNBD_ALPHA02-67 [hydrothermal vent metagenome]|uniref:Uncharacterized protein n=1 Tax=hydrothermal vent metagenome TaxID=652676 RepID=A0A3B0RMZ6_9ZZZZ